MRYKCKLINILYLVGFFLIVGEIVESETLSSTGSFG